MPRKKEIQTLHAQKTVFIAIFQQNSRLKAISQKLIANYFAK